MPARVLPSSLSVALVALVASAPAFAHIELTSPAPRSHDQKVGPCGLADGTRGEIYTAYPPGAVITLRWNETIDHPGHFRASFDDDGDDGFVDPAGFDDLDSAPSVLVDGIADKNGGEYEQEITLPDVECERCTLQLIQVMTDKAPYGDGNDLYYQCADIALRPDAPAEGETFGVEPAGCSHVRVGAGSTTWAFAMAGLLTLLLRRRRGACQ